MVEKIRKRNRICLTIVGILLAIVLLIGFSYAYYSATVKENNKSQTVIKTNELGLIYTGVSEISAPSMIPGDSFKKTFTVENISDVAVDFNIYMENVTNEFNGDLVYTIKDEKGIVVEENVMPKTKEGKTYLKTTINIDAKELRKYTMEIEYKYLEDVDQSENQGAVFSGTVGIDTEKNVTEDETYIVSVDPNGGVYEESEEVQKYTMSSGETVKLKVPTRENHTFKGWTVEEEVVENNTVTVGSSNVTVVAKWELNGDVVAKINNDFYTTIQSAFDAAKTNDTIELLKDTTEKSTNSKTVKLDLGKHKVTGSITNSGILTIINGTIENKNGSAIVNSGTLILGINDEEVSQDSVAIIGTEIGIEQKGTFNFYDGYVEGKVGINGGYNDIPENYYVFVDHNNEKDCQKVYLVDTPSRAVVKTIGIVDAYYFNVQDAINTTVLTNETLYAIRDFEAAYTLTVESGKKATLDIKGYNITTGYTITNNGTFNILDSAEEKGILKPSVTITNNGILNINDISITQTTAANVINNNKELNVTNSTITGLAGYAVSNKTNGTINMDENSYLKANGYGLHNESTTDTVISGGNYQGVYNVGLLTLNGGDYTSGNNAYAIYNDTNGNLKIENANISTTKSGIYNKATMTLNGGNVNAPTGVVNEGTCVVNDFEIISTSRGISNAKTITINNVNINSSDVGVYNTSSLTIKGGEITSTNHGVYNYSGTTTINDGNISSTSGIGLIYERGETIVNGGKITGKTYGTYGSNYYYCGWSCTRTAGAIKIYGGEITGLTSHGLYVSGHTSSSALITGGILKGATYGIYTDGPLTLGTNNDTLSKIPEIKGENYGLYIASGTTNYYDGILIGQTGGYYGTITAMPDATIINESKETIDEKEYITNYLINQENFVKVGDKEYNSLNKAIAAIQTEGTMELIASPIIQKTTVTIPSGKNITFDLNGNTYLTNQTITNNGTLNIIDSSEDKNGLITSASSPNLIVNAGTMILESGNISKTTSTGVPISTTGNLTVNGGKITTPGIGISGSGTVKITDVNITTDGTCFELTGNTTINGGTYNSTTVAGTAGGTTTVNGGTFTSTGNAFVSVGTVNVKGGTFTSSNGYGLYTQRNILNVYDGDIKGVVGVYNDYYVTSTWHDYYGSTVNIYGGNIEGTNVGVQNNNSYLNVYGGNIKGGNYGIYFAGRTLVIGTNNQELTQNPNAIGSLYGLYIASGTASVYDGIFKGQTGGYYGAISAMPDSAIIDESTEIIDEKEYITNYLINQEKFVRVGDVEYSSLNKAIEAIETEGTMVLIASPSVQKATVTIPSGKKVIFDLNGNTYLTTQTITNNGTLTIKDSSEDKSGLITSASTPNLIENVGTMILESGNISKTTSTGVPLSTTGNLTVNGGNITTPGIGISGWGTVKITDVNITTDGTCFELTGNTTIDGGTYNSTTVAGTSGGTTTVNGGTFASTGNAFVSVGTVNVKGGTFTSSNGYGLYTQRNILNVYDGDIKGVVGVYNDYYVTSTWHDYYGSTVNIYGGNIEGTNVGVQNNNSYLNIYGGNIKGGNYGIYFAGRTLVIGTKDDELNQNPNAIGSLYGLYIASGTVNVYDGIFKGQTGGYYGNFADISTDSQMTTKIETIDDKEYITNYLIVHEDIVVNTTTNTTYNNINNALKEANENDILKLTGNVTTYYEINNSNNITLDLNSYQITAVKPITNSGTLTLKDSSVEKTGKIDNMFAINIITNTGTLNINNILLENKKSENYVITNNGTLTLNNSSINCINGINNFSDLDLQNTNVNASTTAISNSGTLVVDGGEIVGESYALYSSSVNAESIENTTLSSSNNSIYKTSKSNMTVKSSDVIGNVTNTGTGKFGLKVEKVTGSLVNNAALTIKLNDIEITKTIQNNNTSGVIDYNTGSVSGEVVNSGTMNLENVTNNYQHSINSNAILFNNSGTLNLIESDLNITKDSIYNISLTAINNTGTVNVTDTEIALSDTSVLNTSVLNTHYGIKNTSSGKVKVDNSNINISGGNVVYGLYSESENNNATILSGNIISDSKTAYGIYVNNGTVTMGEYDGTGTEEAEVSTNSPKVLAVGDTTGIGVKKVNGYFKYYDGKIIGSTNAKPDTTTEVEYNYEAKFYNETDTGYEYCILEYMLQVTDVAKIDSTTYSTLQTAINNANENDTIKLLKDVNEDITVDKNITINLNSKTINGQIVNSGDLTLRNGLITVTDKIPIINNGIVTLGKNDETVDTDDIVIIGDEIGIQQNGTLNIYDGYVMAKDCINGEFENLVDGYEIITKQVGELEKTYLSLKEIKALVVGFDYTGSEQTYVIPQSGTYKLETWGAQGGNQTGVTEGNGYASSLQGGYGSYSTGEIYLEKGETLYINVGGQGGSVTSRLYGGAGGYNGGGSGGDAHTDYFVGSAGGGGATHMATASGLLKDLESNKNSILIVSGGGGGASWRGDKLGHAGGIEGNTVKDQDKIAVGATQETGYAFGQGQNGKKGFDGIGDCEGTGGGGGGYYGGFAYQHNNTGTNIAVSGAGGSGYIANELLTNKYMYCYDCKTSDEENTKTYTTTNASENEISNYAKKGYGYAKITFVEE